MISPRSGRRDLVALVALLCFTACDETRPLPPPPNPDKAVECGVDAGGGDGGAAPGCDAGEVCVQGRCYAACVEDSDCGPREACSGSGVCVRDSDPPPPDPDGGPPPDPDSGPPDPCAGVVCEGAQVCHPLSRSCTECNEASVGLPRGNPGVCDAQPICDIANGTCVAATPAPCAPCNIASDCAGSVFTGQCITRDVFEVREQVCLVACSTTDPACPSGMTCNDGLGLCEPAAGVSCTTWLAGTTARSCTSDLDCNPLAASGAFYPNACEGEVAPVELDGSMVDAGPGTPGACLQPCGVPGDCANTSLTCGTDGFCRAP